MQQHYPIIRPLGQGSSSKTFLAQDLTTVPPIACVIKQVQPSDALQTIGACLQKLPSQPQFPRLLAWGIEAGQGYLVQEYIGGKTVGQQLEDSGVFTTAQICQLLEDVLSGLAILHHQHLIHGDVKPDNLRYRLPDQLGEPAVLVLVDIPGLFLTQGNPEYMAPEQLQGQASVASDLYSLGVTCIHLLTDFRPFDLITGEGRLVWRSYWQPPAQDSASATVRDALGQLLDRLVQPNPTERFPSAEATLQMMAQLGLKTVPRAYPTGTHRVAAPSDGTNPNRPWQCSYTLTGHQGLFATINAVVFHPSGQILISGSDDKTIRLWDRATGQEIDCLTAHTGFVKAIDCSPDGRLLVSGSADRTVQLWNLAERQPDLRLSNLPSVQAVCFSPDGEVVAIGSTDKVIRLWHWADNSVRLLSGHLLGITALAFSPDSKLLASASQDRTVRLWDWQQGQLQQTLTDHTWPVRTVAFSPDGQYLASGGDDNLIYLRALTDHHKLTISGHSWSVAGLAFSPQGQTLVSASWDKTLKLWDTTTGQEQAILTGHTDAIYGLAISQEGTIASCSKDKTINIWQLNEKFLQ